MAIIRDAEPRDAAEIARVHVESWRSTYAGLLPAAYLTGLSQAAITRRWRQALDREEGGLDRNAEGALVADGLGGGVVGFTGFGWRRVALSGYSAEIHTLYLLDEARGAGLGRRLMAAAAERMRAEGAASALVWCLENNPSRWFYERMGGVVLARRAIRFAGAELMEVAYGWPDLGRLARLAAGRERDG